jgi:hypothetical protein
MLRLLLLLRDSDDRALLSRSADSTFVRVAAQPGMIEQATDAIAATAAAKQKARRSNVASANRGMSEGAHLTSK